MSDTVNALNGQAMSCAQAGDIRGAIDNWKKALQINPGDGHIKHNLCVSYYNLAAEAIRRGDVSGAHGEICTALSYDPLDSQARQLQMDIIRAPRR
ncbi:MAG: tetratricopeptide repeat protein [Spirochaetaceae bacterium]|jgi:Tfp pilus assembly protein PilF|nr:tetratricopeptide repeat protein [Spirochaetaceae bacterium]